MRNPGRPIVTGNDFDQPTISWTAAARMSTRAAVEAPTYSGPLMTRMSSGTQIRSGGTAMTTTAVAMRL
jgi:hypothetical protein